MESFEEETCFSALRVTRINRIQLILSAQSRDDQKAWDIISVEKMYTHIALLSSRTHPSHLSIRPSSLTFHNIIASWHLFSFFTFRSFESLRWKMFRRSPWKKNAARPRPQKEEEEEENLFLKWRKTGSAKHLSVLYNLLGSMLISIVETIYLHLTGTTRNLVS